jgi:hypothetical protein
MDESQIAAYLELFDLPDSFTEDQLKQAYRDLVQVWHPDKHSHNERLRKKADEKTKEINEAYHLLQSLLINGSFRFERSLGRAGAPRSGNAPAGAYPPPPETQTQAAASTPQDAPHPTTAIKEPEVLRGNAFWILLIAVTLLVILAAPRGRKVAAPERPPAEGPPADTELPVLLSIEGPQTRTNSAPFPISKAVDTKYGFKELRFGMSIDEARRRLKPDRITTNQYLQLVTFWYGTSTSNKLGDFPLDFVNASFFHEQLFKIEVSFSSNSEQILDALRSRFGASCPNDSLTRGSSPLRAECWFGEKVFCAIVAPRNSNWRTGWDGMVLYDQALNRDAQKYAREEPIRAAQALSEDGYGEFKFGMTLKEFGRKLRHPPAVTEVGLGQKDAVIAKAEECKLGRYPLSSVTASFYRDKLFRLELDFDLNQSEIYKGFLARFPGATDDDSWSRNGEALRAKQYAGHSTVVAILAPHAGSATWDSVVLYDRQMDERQRNFERDAPKRAAKDL